MVDATSPFILAVGLMLGLEHAFDVDHVVAVTNFLCNVKSFKKSLYLGAVWGLGHTATVLVAGVVVLALRVMIPESFTRLFTIIAGALLIVLGVLVVKGVIVERTCSSSSQSTQPILMGPQLKVATEGSHAHKSLFSGILQGLAGSAALMLVTLSTVESPVLGIIFIGLFGLGVILGMLSCSALIGGFLALTSMRIDKVHEIIKAVTGCTGVGFGIYIILTAILR